MLPRAAKGLAMPSTAMQSTGDANQTLSTAEPHPKSDAYISEVTHNMGKFRHPLTNHIEIVTQSRENTKNTQNQTKNWRLSHKSEGKNNKKKPRIQTRTGEFPTQSRKNTNKTQHQHTNWRTQRKISEIGGKKAHRPKLIKAHHKTHHAFEGINTKTHHRVCGCITEFGHA